MKEILQKGPWTAMNHMLCLQQWDPKVSVLEMEFSKIAVWVQVHGLPFGAMSIKNAATIMGHIGEVVEIEDPIVEGIFLMSFLRVCVLINIQQPIPTGCWIPRKFGYVFV